MELSKRSRVRLVIKDKPLYYKELAEICSDGERCIWKYILNRGEEYGVILSIDPKLSNTVIDYMEKYGIPYRIIGRVEEGDGLEFVNEPNQKMGSI